jgi:hypothetical protein
MTIIEPHAKPRIGKQLEDRTFEFDQFFFSQRHLLSTLQKTGDAAASPDLLLALTLRAD